MAQFELNGVSLDIPDRFLTKRIRTKLTHGRYEINKARAVQLAIDHGDRVLELGSGIGYISSICAMLAGAENVLCVEANAELLDTARANLDRNECAQTELMHGAVMGRVPDTQAVALRKGQRVWATTLIDEDIATDAAPDVPALSVHALIAQHRPDVVVLDVEGAEADMFDQLWPEHIRVVALELHPRLYSDQVTAKIFDCMARSDLVYSPDISRGALVGFCRLGASLDGT